MTLDRWHEIKPLLNEILDLSLSARETFLNKHSIDAELRSALEAYLEIEEEDIEYLEQPVLDIMAGRAPEFRGGEVLNETFRLEEEIARGGMGVVYRASRIHADFEQAVAVKVLKRGYDTGGFVRRFRKERQILARLDHPYLTRLLDGGTTKDGLPYLVMELVQGVRLDEYLDAEKPGLPERLALFQEICEAVQTAHRSLVVHCDLKPSNILVTADGHPKVLDFGIAKVLQEDKHTRSLALRLGSPNYASPEQASGAPITTSSDLYALGGLLHLLLVGEPPNRREDELASLTGPLRALEARFSKTAFPEDLPSGWREGVRPALGDLDAIARKAMKWDPAERYGSAAELAEDVARHLNQQPISAKRYTWWDDLRLLARRRRGELRVAAAALLIIAATAGYGFAAWLEAQLNETHAIDAYMEILELADFSRDESLDESVRGAVNEFKALGKLEADKRAAILDRLGRFLLRLGHLKESRLLLQEALVLRQNLSKNLANLELLAASLNNLALLEKKSGDLERAADLYVEALALHLKYPKMARAQYLNILNNLANLNQRLSLLDQAETQHREVLNGRMELFGEDSLEVAESYSNLGGLLSRRDRLDEAEPMLRKAFDLRLDRLGFENDKTQTAQSKLAAFWLARGKYDEAIDAYRTVLKARIEMPAVDRSKIALSHSALGIALVQRQQVRDLAEAEQHLKFAIDEFQKKPADAERLWVSQRNLAAVWLVHGRFEDAEHLLRQILSQETWTRRDIWRADDVRSLLGECLTKQGRFDEARPLLEGAIPRLAEKTGEQSRHTRHARRRLQEWQEAVTGRPVDPMKL